MTRFAVGLVAVLVASGCASTRSSTSAGTLAATIAPIAEGPRGCLADAGLSRVSFRGGGTWRGVNTQPFFTVAVRRFATVADARRARAAAGRVVARGGRFVVIGPPRSVDDHGVIAAVATCLHPR